MKRNLLRNLALAAVVSTSAAAAANPRAAILIGYGSVDDIDNFQESAAAEWFVETHPDGTVITPGNEDLISAKSIDCIWIHIDRINIGQGYTNLPSAFNNPTTIAALKQYLADGGNLLLTKQATQLVVPIGRVDAQFAPNLYGDGDGGIGTDVWTVQAQIGYWFTKADGGNDMSQFYDRRGHKIYEGLSTSADFEWETFPLLGTGTGAEMWREDHNCMWDLNAFSYAVDGKNTVEKFEKQNSAVVLGQWGHVQDHAVAGIVEFLPTETYKGHIIANGLAACEWSPRQGGNAFHNNLQLLTKNSVSYLADQSTAGVEGIELDNTDAAPRYYNLQGIEVSAENLSAGLYIVRQGTKTSKVVVK